MSQIGLDLNEVDLKHHLVPPKETIRFNSFASISKENDIEMLEDVPQKDKLRKPNSDSVYQIHRLANNIVNQFNALDDSLNMIHTCEEISSLESSNSENWLMEGKDNYYHQENDSIQQQNKLNRLSGIASIRNPELFHNKSKDNHRKKYGNKAPIDGIIKSLYSNSKVNSELEISNILNTLDERIENGLLKPRKKYKKSSNEISYLSNTKKEEKGRFKQFIFRYIR